ncbi:hypothetical protein Q427_10875 [Halomonas sp. BC04]|nr:hypothetical protein Q427_10875 [Halomonas sp. BC04]
MGSNVIGWFKETLGINSPSRIFAGSVAICSMA